MIEAICNKCPIYNDGLIQLGVRHNICGAPRYMGVEGKLRILAGLEAFGETEDKLNAPLVGRSGKLFDKLIQESGLIKYYIKIDNAVKCRPIKLDNGKYKNRTPTDEEIECCRPYLADTLSFNPEMIILFGRIPFKLFFPDKEASQYRGKGLIYNHNGKAIMTTLVYHPAYCLYNPSSTPLLLKQLTNICSYLDKIEQSKNAA